ncbi:hypothetical protein R6Q59_003649 [Mikania micrantha]
MDTGATMETQRRTAGVGISDNVNRRSKSGKTIRLEGLLYTNEALTQYPRFFQMGDVGFKSLPQRNRVGSGFFSRVSPGLVVVAHGRFNESTRVLKSVTHAHNIKNFTVGLPYLPKVARLVIVEGNCLRWLVKTLASVRVVGTLVMNLTLLKSRNILALDLFIAIS